MKKNRQTEITLNLHENKERIRVKINLPYLVVVEGEVNSDVSFKCNGHCHEDRTSDRCLVEWVQKVREHNNMNISLKLKVKKNICYWFIVM